MSVGSSLLLGTPFDRLTFDKNKCSYTLACTVVSNPRRGTMAPAAPDVRLMFGPIMFGVFLNMILYGVLLVQVYYYYLASHNDKKWLKVFVFYLLIAESVNSGCDMYLIYEPVVERFGLPVATEYFPTMFAAEPINVVAISTPIQIFLAWRVWKLTESRILPIFICSLALTSMAGGLWTTYRVITEKLFSKVLKLHTPALIWLISSCIADVLITMVLVYALHRKRTGHVATDDVISKIIRMTIQTGLLTAVLALADVVFFMVLNHTLLNFLWDLPLSKLYSNSLLSNLNARATLWSTNFTEFHSAQRPSSRFIPARQKDSGFSMETMFPTRQSMPVRNGTRSARSLIRSHELVELKSIDRHPDLGVSTGPKIKEAEDDNISESSRQ